MRAPIFLDYWRYTPYEDNVRTKGKTIFKGQTFQAIDQQGQPIIPTEDCRLVQTDFLPFLQQLGITQFLNILNCYPHVEKRQIINILQDLCKPTPCPDCDGRGIINHNPFPIYLDFARNEIYIAVCTTCNGTGIMNFSE